MKVFIIAAVTANGFIARHKEEFADWTSREDKKLFVELTKRAGVMVMGGTTYRTICRALPGRRNIVYSRGPIEQEGIEVTAENPKDLVARLASEGCAELAVCGGAAIYELFLQAGVVDEIYLTVEPIMFGGGVQLFAKGADVHLTLLDHKKLNDNTMLLHYKVEK